MGLFDAAADGEPGGRGSTAEIARLARRAGGAGRRRSGPVPLGGGTRARLPQLRPPGAAGRGGLEPGGLRRPRGDAAGGARGGGRRCARARRAASRPRPRVAGTAPRAGPRGGGPGGRRWRPRPPGRPGGGGLRPRRRSWPWPGRPRPSWSPTCPSPRRWAGLGWPWPPGRPSASPTRTTSRPWPPPGPSWCPSTPATNAALPEGVDRAGGRGRLSRGLRRRAGRQPPAPRRRRPADGRRPGGVGGVRRAAVAVPIARRPPPGRRAARRSRDDRPSPPRLPAGPNLGHLPPGPGRDRARRPRVPLLDGRAHPVAPSSSGVVSSGGRRATPPSGSWPPTCTPTWRPGRTWPRPS